MRQRVRKLGDQRVKMMGSLFAGWGVAAVGIEAGTDALLHAFDDAAPGQMRIDAKAVANQLHLRFSDNGRGMDANIAARAFDPFFTTRRGSGGSGLGLHVTHNLVTQLLGGDIELSTAPGQGAQFLIRIPLQAP